jgi:hypothetical protein
MITLKESILGKTKDKIKDTAKCMDVIEREQKNLPKVSDFKLKYGEYILNWMCPNLIKLAIDNVGAVDNPLLNNPQGFRFNFHKDGNCIYVSTIGDRGMFFPLMGWGKFEVANDDCKEVIINIIKKMSDIDNMMKIFDHYNKFCYRKTEEGKSLLNDL